MIEIGNSGNVKALIVDDETIAELLLAPEQDPGGASHLHGLRQCQNGRGILGVMWRNI